MKVPALPQPKAEASRQANRYVTEWKLGRALRLRLFIVAWQKGEMRLARSTLATKEAG
jgi:hypothetical protein